MMLTVFNIQVKFSFFQHPAQESGNQGTQLWSNVAVE